MKSLVVVVGGAAGVYDDDGDVDGVYDDDEEEGEVVVFGLLSHSYWCR